MQASDLVGDLPFSHDVLVLSIRGSQEMKPSMRLGSQLLSGVLWK